MGRILIDGNEAVVRGALYAGCRFFAGYPITPASSILSGMLEALPPAGGMVMQGEDEIASIGYCLGASMAGLKAMTATSGPGISLYSENISFAIGSEIPLMIVNVMRQGPSTGAATRGADGDVHFMRWGNSGGLPVIVLAPTSAPDCFTLTVHAFNLAERFRCPVFVVSNKEIGMTRETVDLDRLERPPVIDRAIHREGAFLPFAAQGPDGVPPFLPLGGSVPVRQTSSMHGPDGYITTDPHQIQALVERLTNKVEAHVDEFSFYDLDAQADARTLLVTYGVTARAARTAVSRLRAQGTPVSLLVLKTLWPVPERVIRRAARHADRILVVEMNLGQLVHEIRRVLCAQQVDFFGLMCGRLIRPSEIVQEVCRD
ncbi:2-oxoglutarate ferredoxin oxidoreductase subunit alpha [Desulfacinum hydrothermale DSM 13146]|uniref:2-oxoglutarate ferredoxin oxidoreductase subunit alpha n=1 Tax=Desulfacinum hydrothermale DSM 13146 TaxID=1121390 RepID=A0A1W1XEN3_9BACT|nr:pyruvate flavodoxin/ferredoxin oxidoreductase [Desulfacinum hydrothermale]SMC21961.1 2-oxoglutarate ferredoxin oxidoreductase subunit alpha [Desulfacinum hydrothermale DSM 13146]